MEWIILSKDGFVDTSKKIKNEEKMLALQDCQRNPEVMAHLIQQRKIKLGEKK